MSDRELQLLRREVEEAGLAAPLESMQRLFSALLRVGVSEDEAAMESFGFTGDHSLTVRLGRGGKRHALGHTNWKASPTSSFMAYQEAGISTLCANRLVIRERDVKSLAWTHETISPDLMCKTCLRAIREGRYRGRTLQVIQTAALWNAFDVGVAPKGCYVGHYGSPISHVYCEFRKRQEVLWEIRNSAP